jgi:hypothetical protein
MQAKYWLVFLIALALTITGGITIKLIMDDSYNQPVVPKFFALSFTNVTYVVTQETDHNAIPTLYQVNFTISNKWSQGVVHTVSLTYLPWSGSEAWVNGEYKPKVETLFIGNISIGQSVNVQMNRVYINPNAFSTSNGNAGTRAFEFDFRSTDYPSNVDSLNNVKDYQTIQVKYYCDDKILKVALGNSALGNDEPVPMLGWSVG